MFKPGLITTAILSAVFACAAFAQQTGTLKGTITDDFGGVIPGAAVSIKGQGIARAVQTQGDGTFAVPGIPPGEYAVSVSFPGFSVAERSVQVAAGAAQQLPIQLKVAAERQEISVTADAGPTVSVEPENNASSIVLKGEDLEALPDDPDDLQDALQALAGPGAGPGGGAIYIDGFSGGDMPPKESIREVRVNQNPFSAEYDRLGYGRIEILTKPGSDRFRGELFLNSANAVFNSRNPFSANKPDFSNHRYGGDFGGPIGKKMSYFLDFSRRDTDDNAVVYAPDFIDPVTLLRTPIQQSVVTPSRWTRIAPRFDRQFGANNTLTVRFQASTFSRDNQGIGGYQVPPPYSSLGYNTNGSNQDLAITETSVLSAHLVNETRFQFSRTYSESLGNTSMPTIRVAGAFTTGGDQTGSANSTSRRFELQNITSYSRGSHTIRFGVRARRLADQQLSPSNYGGTYSFVGGAGPVLDANNNPVLNADGTPQTQSLLAVDQYYRTLLFQNLGYAPDQIRALGGGASRFTINAGNPFASIVQYDVAPWVQDDWRVRPGLTLSLGLRYEAQTNVSDYSDIAVRAGFAWAPGAGARGNSRTVIRGGFGMFYDRVPANLTMNVEQLNGVNQLSYVVENPDSFPLTPSLEGLTPQQNSIYRLSQDYRAPYSLQASLSVERQLPWHTNAAATYTFTRANHLAQTVPLNAPFPGTYPYGQPELGIQPLGDAGNIFEYQSGGLMTQNMLMLNFNTRLSRTLSLFGNYSYSHSEDLPNQPANPYNFAEDWGRSSLDRRHRFQLAGSVPAPLGLRFSPFLVVQSGAPYNVSLGTDPYGTTWENARPAFSISPDDPYAVCRAPFGCFTAPRPGSGLELVPRNYQTGEGMLSFNIRAARVFGFGAPRRGADRAANSSSAPAGGAGRGGGGGGGRGGPGGGGGGGPRGGGGGFGGLFNETSDRRYTLTLSVMVNNILNHFNPGSYEGNILSPQFGQPISALTGFGGGGPGGPGGGFSSGGGNRRLEFQARFSF